MDTNTGKPDWLVDARSDFDTLSHLGSLFVVHRQCQMSVLDRNKRRLTRMEAHLFSLPDFRIV